jgi:F-type H+-transporting ATPase subunit epsilon
MNLIHFKFVTPERTLFDGQAMSVTCMTELGQITVLPHHAPLVAKLVPGEIVVVQENATQSLHASGGFLQVEPGSQVIALADSAEFVAEIDLARAEQAVQKARERLAHAASLSAQEYAVTAALLERNLSRTRIARKRSHRRTNITSEGVFEE